MNKSNNSARPHTVLTPAQRMVQKLMAISPREDAEAILERVRIVRAFLENPATAAEREEILRGVLLPWPIHSPAPWTGFQGGQLVTQPKSQDADGLPRYVFPLPGSPALVVGSPSGRDMLDSANWNPEKRRWEGADDLLVLVSTPDGIHLLTVESSDFVPYTPEVSQRDEALVAACLEVLQELDGHFTEETQKPGTEEATGSQEEGTADAE